ncbi:MAG TPA: hypothetical protein VJ373_06385 [Desulfatiglandales bacterium]|nr:hypothetical protein [Desulfatiglandales bacterium]
MSQQELLKRIIQALDQVGIQYMITGSIVSSLQGEPRSTHDIDIIIAIQKSKVHKLVKAFPPSDFYFDEHTFIEAINRRGMADLIDLKGGDKVDLWMLTDDPFDRSRFSRRYSEEFMGIKMQISRPEDTILAKLRWAKLSGGSEKQFTDALRVYEVQYGKLDMAYLEEWVRNLDIEPLWDRLIAEAETT